jgi:hypothetical protein
MMEGVCPSKRGDFFLEGIFRFHPMQVNPERGVPQPESPSNFDRSTQAMSCL